jgi:endonuclease YncB( thermonuclease family)
MLFPGKETPFFSLKGHECQARVVSVYDGDTVTVVMELAKQFWKFKVRLAGIDTCEMKSKDLYIQNKAKEARNRLVELITGSKDTSDFETDEYLVWVNCKEMDKYGRVLADLYVPTKDSRSFSEVLLEEGLAYEYNGQTKLTEIEQQNLFA